jgi:hypothetical protein
MIDHFTYHVDLKTLHNGELADFLSMLGLVEIDADDPLYTHELPVRWFRFKTAEPPQQTRLHLVATADGERDLLALGHFCITGVEMDLVHARAVDRGWLSRASGSGRIWLQFDNLRVEVRP